MTDAALPLDAVALAEAVRTRRVGAEEVVSAALERIAASQATVNAFSEVLGEAALRDARAIDALPSGDDRPLLSVPLAVKDNIETADGRTTHGSRALADQRAGRDADVVARLRHAGCIVVGKTTMPELALRATTESEAYGVTRNPLDLARTPGGSSGGSAAAVAAGLVPLALGNDAGGSVRIPASWCGVVGVKPSRGRFPWTPERLSSWCGLGTHGILAATLRDAEIAFDAVAVRAASDPPPQRLRVAVAGDGPLGPVPAPARDAVERAAERLAAQGHRVERACPDLGGLVDAYLTIATVSTAAEAPAGIDWELTEPYTQEVARRAGEIGAVELQRTLALVEARTAEVTRFWQDHDVLLTPTTTVSAPLLETRPDDPERWRDYLTWAQFLFPFNLTGQPAISVPWPPTAGAAPLGVQLVGAPGRDDVVFAATFGMLPVYEEAIRFAAQLAPR